MKFTHGMGAYVIAEIGANHNGDMALARRMIDEAKRLGCDCVKFQSWDTKLFSRTVYEQNFFLSDDYRERKDHSLRTIMEAYAVSKAEMGKLKAYCDKVGIDFASTPFERDQIDALVEFDAPFIKIASMDVNNDHLLSHAAKTSRPVMMSTGLSSMAEIDHAVETLEANGAREIVLLHCVSLYPPRNDEVNLRNMEMLRQAYGYPVGFSDHTFGSAVPLAAVALGAVVIEKHFTLDKTMEGWDHKISADPPEMREIVEGARKIHECLGVSRRTLSAREIKQREAYRRSIVSARDIRKGAKIVEDDLCYRRPGTGLAPNLAPSLIGQRAVRDIPADALIAWADFGMGG